jgi:2-polyprenyl-6-methoxyphenol hydroxylase-like FAD-dependent oxidoreductase
LAVRTGVRYPPAMRVLIAGGGQVGGLIARRLSREGNEVTIVDHDPERCAHLEQSLDVRVLALRAAGVSWMEATRLAFVTLGTRGFSTRTASDPALPRSSGTASSRSARAGG